MATTNGNFSQQDQYKGPTEHYTATTTVSDASGGQTNVNGDLSKDEIGWYFVEQYYTTLSKSPEKLHLYYGKRSQFVSGLEAEVAPVSVGRGAIQDRIKGLDFQDCKVRVSNVDSQASDENIVIQVIGETSMSAEPKKFVQTFVLAQQPTGYFVLNDIFRYINEEIEEEVASATIQEDAPVAPKSVQPGEGVEIAEPESVADAQEQAEPECSTVEKDPKENINEKPPTDAESQNSSEDKASKPDEPEEAEVPSMNVELKTPNPEVEAPVEEIKQSEEAKEPASTLPEVTRLPSTTKPAAPQPAVPAKPMSWASVAVAGATASAPRPAVPAPKAVSPSPSQVRAPPATQPTQTITPTSTPQSAPTIKNNKENEAPPQTQGSGWQTAGSDHSKRQNRPLSVSGPIEREGTMGYVKNVTEGVGSDELRATLSSYGELIHFDINRQKNCAFVEFATLAGYQAAAAANPHLLGGEQIYVEPRRPKSSAYGSSNYNVGRGGINGRGRGGFDQGRTPSQRGRGDFGSNRGRGTPRSRGTNQPTNT